MFDLVRPCPKCPFRSDVPPYLRRERAVEIARSLADGNIFPCHETTIEDPDDEGQLVAGPKSQFCAGALLVLEAGEAPNQAMRMAERLDYYDPEKLDRSAPTVGSLAEFVNHHAAGDDLAVEAEACHVANSGCEAPAGYLVGGQVVLPSADEMGDVHECPCCGEPTCDSCTDEASGLCFYCADTDP